MSKVVEAMHMIEKLKIKSVSDDDIGLQEGRGSPVVDAHKPQQDQPQVLQNGSDAGAFGAAAVQFDQVEENQRDHEEEEVDDQEGVGSARDQVEREEDEQGEVAHLQLLHLCGQLHRQGVVLRHHRPLLGEVVEVHRAVLSLFLRLFPLALFVFVGTVLPGGIDQLLDHFHDDDDEEEEDYEEAEEDGAALAVLSLRGCHNSN